MNPAACYFMGWFCWICTGLLSFLLLLSCTEEEPLYRYVAKKAPIAKCAIKSINEKPYVAGTVVRPLDDVVLTAEGSVAQTPGAEIADYHWEIVWQPSGSNSALVSAESKETGFVFAQSVHGIDLAGNYRVKLVVTDSMGTQNTEECSLKWSAIPADLLHVQLVWDTNYGDMDLHLAKKDSQNRYCVSALNEEGKPGPLGEICQEPVEFSECNYSSCRSYHDDKRPNWDLDPKRASAGDPRLDIDDLSGFGPENINIEQPHGGTFLVSVHHFAGGRPSGNTVRIYLYGYLYAEFYRVLQPNMWWEVAVIEWPENMSAYPCVQDLATQKVECPRPDAQYRAGPGSNFMECLNDAECGPNTSCDLEAHQCVSKLNHCSSNADCPLEKLCALRTHACVLPECETDRHCQASAHDSRYKCDTSTYTCYLPKKS